MLKRTSYSGSAPSLAFSRKNACLHHSDNIMAVLPPTARHVRLDRGTDRVVRVQTIVGVRRHSIVLDDSDLELLEYRAYISAGGDGNAPPGGDPDGERDGKGQPWTMMIRDAGTESFKRQRKFANQGLAYHTILARLGANLLYGSTGSSRREESFAGLRIKGSKDRRCRLSIRQQSVGYARRASILLGW